MNTLTSLTASATSRTQPFPWQHSAAVGETGLFQSVTQTTWARWGKFNCCTGGKWGSIYYWPCVVILNYEPLRASNYQYLEYKCYFKIDNKWAFKLSFSRFSINPNLDFHRNMHIDLIHECEVVLQSYFYELGNIEIIKWQRRRFWFALIHINSWFSKPRNLTNELCR